MNVLISWVLVVIIVITGIGIVMLASSSVLGQAGSASSLSQAEQASAQLSNAIKDVSREGIGSSRIVSIPNLNGIWRLVSEEDMVEFSMSSSPFEMLMHRVNDERAYISGFDANCSVGAYAGAPAWILENNYIKVYLQKSNGTLDTARNILAMQSKVTNVTIAPTDSSIVIDDNAATSSGTGWSTMKVGSLPRCRAHFFVNTTSVNYDIYYTLYSGADFLTVDVRNIKP